MQSRDESLGVSVAGGVKNQKGDTPIYISNITDMGCVGRTRQIQVSQPTARPVSVWYLSVTPSNMREK